ncbi:trypsin-like serine peptidase [Embleya sp. NPDC001921]
MAANTDLIETVQRMFPDLDSVTGELNRNLTAGADSDLESNVGPGANADGMEGARQQTLALGARALEKVARDGTRAVLTDAESQGLEAVVLVMGRPAILVQDDRFLPPPHPWETLEDHREAIEATMLSVGRIEVRGHPMADWIGTGFLVADDAVLTNRHVVKEFMAFQQDQSHWEIAPEMSVNIDFAEQLGGTPEREHRISEIIAIHPDLDLALLRMEPGDDPPPPLPFAGPRLEVEPERLVYIVGYPAADSRRSGETDIQRIFNGIFNVKRLLPGKITAVDTGANLFEHDCSTMGGNSGSCVVDLTSNRVIGVHFRGRYLKTNWGISTQNLIGDIQAAARANGGR